MDQISNYATLVIAIMTIFYTLGTFLLWIETRKTLELAIAESERTQKQIKTNLISNIVASHRELFMYILSNENLPTLICKNSNTDVFKSGFLATLLLNNVLQIFYHYKEGDIDEETWLSLVGDIKELFGWPIVIEQWSEYRKFCIDDFRDFIEKEILKKLEKKDYKP